MGIYSKLHNYTYQQLKRNFPEFTIRENIHPDWLISSDLTRLELDLFIEEINTAIEVQGEQHYRFVPHFHGDHDGYKKRLRFDQEKRDLCYGRGIRLIEISTQLDVEFLISEFLPTEPNPPKYSYSNPGLDKQIIKEIRDEQISHKKIDRKTRKQMAVKKTMQGTLNKYTTIVKDAINQGDLQKALTFIIRYERKNRLFDDIQINSFREKHEVQIQDRIKIDNFALETQRKKETDISEAQKSLNERDGQLAIKQDNETAEVNHGY